MTTATKTVDHDEIRKWVEERGGRPARVNARGHKEGGGILRIDFKDPGGENGEALEHISWEEFFRTFDQSKLAFLHQDETSDGRASRFNKFVSRSD